MSEYQCPESTEPLKVISSRDADFEYGRHGNPNKRRGDSGFESLQVGTFGIASTGAFALAARDRGPANFENSTESQGGRRELRKKSISEEQESQ